jgi:hypothetical protein
MVCELYMTALSYQKYLYRNCLHIPLINISTLRDIQSILTDGLVYIMPPLDAMTGTKTIVKPDGKNYYLDDIDSNLSIANIRAEKITDCILSHGWWPDNE